MKEYRSRDANKIVEEKKEVFRRRKGRVLQKRESRVDGGFTSASFNLTKEVSLALTI